MNLVLKELQEGLQNYILHDDAAIVSQVISSHQHGAKARLYVYQDSYYSRLIEILAIDFPMVKIILGEKKFNKIAWDYVQSHPARHYAIRQYGKQFAQFLANEKKIAPKIVELAVFEWLLSDLEDAADANVMGVAEISKIPPESWEEMQLQLIPAMQIFSAFYSAPQLWYAILQQEPLPTIRRHKNATPWLVWRRNLQPCFAPLSLAELTMLQAIQMEQSFGAICQQLCAHLPEKQVGQFAATTLSRWLGQGIFTKIILK